MSFNIPLRQPSTDFDIQLAVVTVKQIIVVC